MTASVDCFTVVVCTNIGRSWFSSVITRVAVWLLATVAWSVTCLPTCCTSLPNHSAGMVQVAQPLPGRTCLQSQRCVSTQHCDRVSFQLVAKCSSLKPKVWCTLRVQASSRSHCFGELLAGTGALPVHLYQGESTTPTDSNRCRPLLYLEVSVRTLTTWCIHLV